MTLLVVAVVLVGLLSLVNLLFTLGVIRRLREHTEILTRLSAGGDGSVMLPAGASIEDFAATTLDGESVSATTADGRLLVGFFSVGCEYCTKQLPFFLERAREHPGGRDRVLAVVVARDSEDVRDYLEPLAHVARVVREDTTGPVTHAFGVQGFPAFAMVDTGRVVLASGAEVAALTASAVAV